MLMKNMTQFTILSFIANGINCQLRTKNEKGRRHKLTDNEFTFFSTIFSFILSHVCTTFYNLILQIIQINPFQPSYYIYAHIFFNICKHINKIQLWKTQSPSIKGVPSSPNQNKKVLIVFLYSICIIFFLRTWNKTNFLSPPNNIFSNTLKTLCKYISHIYVLCRLFYTRKKFFHQFDKKKRIEWIVQNLVTHHQWCFMYKCLQNRT